jgi:hypothetical protein
MKVFHGSNVKIESIDLAKSGSFKDFGKGFYVTSIQKHAIQRSVEIAEGFGGKPAVSEFEYSENYVVTAKLSIKKFDEHTAEWVNFVIMNRNKNIKHPAHSFDIVEGPIADDKMVVQIERYQRGKISIDELIQRLTYIEPTHQICFCTAESLYALDFIKDSERDFAVDDTTDSIIEAIITDFSVGEEKAMNAFFTSSLYKKFVDADTLLWQRPWLEIYESFKAEFTSTSKCL